MQQVGKTHLIDVGNWLRRRMTVGVASGAILVASVSMLATAQAANAAISGDYFVKLALGPENGRVNDGEAYNFIETEGWVEYNAAGNCNGVSNSEGTTWYGEKCISAGPPPDETYCTTKCEGKTGFPFIFNRSPTNDDNFTGWLYANS